MILLKLKLSILRKNIKKILLLFYLILIAPTLCFSQTISKIIITSDQLKTANLIFLEHQKFKKEIYLLNKELVNWKQINKSWQHTDSIYRFKLENQNRVIQDQSKIIYNLEKSYKKKKVIIYGTSGTCLALLLCLLLK